MQESGTAPRDPKQTFLSLPVNRLYRKSRGVVKRWMQGRKGSGNSSFFQRKAAARRLPMSRASVGTGAGGRAGVEAISRIYRK
jgi:hypothetical protein